MNFPLTTTRLKPAILFLCITASALWSSGSTAQLNIVVEGVTDQLHDQAIASLSVVNYSEREDLGELLIRQLFIKGKSQLKQALQPFGYYRAHVTGTLTPPNATDSAWQLRYQLTPGPQSVWGKIDVAIDGAGQNDSVLAANLQKHLLISGRPVFHPDYGSLKSSIQTTASERGYFDALWVNSAIQVMPAVAEKAPIVDVTLKFSSGERYSFGELNWPELPFDRDLMQRFAKVEVGEPYNAATLRRLQYRLQDSGYFDDVVIAPDLSNPSTLTVPLDLQLTLRRQNRYSGGLGIGTDTGLRATAAWQARWVNSGGHRAGTELQLSEISQQLSLRYDIPIRDPATDSLRFSLVSRRQLQPDSENILHRFASEWSIRRNGWTWRSFVRVENEESKFNGAAVSTSNLVIPGFAAERLSVDHVQLPTRGYRLNFQIHGAHEKVLSDATFIQLRARIATLNKISSNWRILSRVEAAGNLVSEFSQLPISQRFFAGGDNSVRGFRYQSLSPTSSSGEQVGGQHLLAGSIELEWSFAQSWAVAVFTDAGNSFDDKFKIRRAAGLGLRWKLPIGALRIDVATPIDQNEIDPRLHISLGPDL